jgi:hypothetical protein
LAAGGALEGLRGALKTAAQAVGEVKLFFGLVNEVDGIAKSRTRGEIKGDRGGWELPLVVRKLSTRMRQCFS